MQRSVTSLDETTAIGRTVDAAFHYTGLLVRAGAYLLVYAFADRYDCGPAILTGALLGDFLGQLVRVFADRHHSIVSRIADLALIGLVWLLLRPDTIWPEHNAMRAILGLAAFGVLVGHAGKLLTARFDDRDF
ncbi:MAG: hypothetical protein KDE27_10220 [Planctomycetes bacterium]|nr:hypothetical protein [Planctomycetota bacterium]